MFIPLWVFGLGIAAYFGVGLLHCVRVIASPHLPSFRDYLLCLFLWPVFYLR